MVRIAASDELRGKLGQAEVVVELCVRSGHTPGHFVPVTGMRQDETSEECPFTEEELARMRSEAGGRTLAEFWARLGRRSCP